MTEAMDLTDTLSDQLKGSAQSACKVLTMVAMDWTQMDTTAKMTGPWVAAQVESLQESQQGLC